MFKLNIGTLTITGHEYGKLMTILAELRTNVDKAITDLTDAGWSGESRDKFLEKHQKNQELYAKLEADVEYMRNALENEEKPRAIQLKKRSEDFVNCINRSGNGGAITGDDEGIITLDGNEFPINNSVDNCTSSYYPKMNSNFEEILNLANNMEYTSFAIGGDVFSAQTSIRNQTTSLTDFDDSFNIYCNGVKDMESNICSVLSKISDTSNSTSNIGSSSVISPSGEIDTNKLIEVVLKASEDLADEIDKAGNKVVDKKEQFYNMMEKTYGFNKEQTDLIKKAYDLSIANTDYLTTDEIILQGQLRIDNPYYQYELSKDDKVKNFLGNLSTLGSYSGFQWGWVANTPTVKEEKDYFKGIGMSDDEIKKLTESVLNQHHNDIDGKKDFAHEIVEVASFLNEDTLGGRTVVDVGAFGETNEMSNFKGDIWSGSMTQSDLLSNIDSTNIYSRMKKDKDGDFMDIFTDYNKSVINKETSRVDEFCKNYGDGDIEKGKSNIKEIVESWSPAAEYDTGEYKLTIPHIIGGLKDDLVLSAYMDSDIGLQNNSDEVDKILDDMAKDKKDYNDKKNKQDWLIKDAKYEFYNYLGIQHVEESKYGEK